MKGLTYGVMAERTILTPSSSGQTSKYCQQNCQQRVLNILDKIVVEQGKVVSTNSIKAIISVLKTTRRTDESYLRSQQLYRWRGAEAPIVWDSKPWVRAGA